ncbi:MAG: radical SAM protein [Candidatus Omnitrophota bacterium]
MIANNIEKSYRHLEESVGFYCGSLFYHPFRPPEHVYFSLTTRCNLRCLMCEVSKNPSVVENELATEKIKEIILQIKQMKIAHLIFSGGEPLLRQDFLEIIEYASAAIERVDVITNGLLFSDLLIQRLVELQLNHITFSLDGLERTNDKIRGRGVFASVKENIDRFKYYKSKHQARFPTLGINFTITSLNVDEMLPMIEFARTSGLNAILFQPVLFNNVKMNEKDKNDLWLSGQEIDKLKTVVHEIVKIKAGLDDFVICCDNELLQAFPGYFSGTVSMVPFRCYEAIKRIVITTSGKVWSCIGEYGDLLNDSLQTIWLSENALRVRHSVARCKANCVQECVYLPLQIKDLIRDFFAPLTEEKKDDYRKRLVRTLNEYQAVAQERKTPVKNSVNNIEMLAEIARYAQTR